MTLRNIKLSPSTLEETNALTWLSLANSTAKSVYIRRIKISAKLHAFIIRKKH